MTSTLGTHCTFCTKPAAQVERMIAGPGVYICNECVGLCAEILEQAKGSSMSLVDPDALSDAEILGLLPQIAAVATQVEGGLNDWVRRLRGRGVSWARIGTALGTTRQSAWERFSGEH